MLLDAVLGKVRNNRGGPRSWFQRLPSEAREELEAVRQSFNSGLHQKRAFALAIIEAAKERGWEIAKEKQVIEWLERKA